MDYLVKIRSVQTPLNGQFSIGANSRCQTVDFDIKQKHYAEVTQMIKKRYPALDESYIKRSLPDLRQIIKRAKLLS